MEDVKPKKVKKVAKRSEAWLKEHKNLVQKDCSIKAEGIDVSVKSDDLSAKKEDLSVKDDDLSVEGEDDILTEDDGVNLAESDDDLSAEDDDILTESEDGVLAESKVKFKFSDLVKWLKNDDIQRKGIESLAKERGLSANFLQNEGIIYVPTIDELWRVIDSNNWDEHELGITEANQELFNHGYIIPVLDSYGRLLMFINHSVDRPKEMKYININLYKRGKVLAEEEATYDGSRDEVLHKDVKMIGLETTKLGLKLGKMYVVEGVFDNKRVKSLGLPITGLLGSKLMAYQKLYYKKFRHVYYIQDLDTTGDKAWREFKKGVPQAVRVVMPSLKYLDKNEDMHYVKDIDEFGKQSKDLYAKEWEAFVTDLKAKP